MKLVELVELATKYLSILFVKVASIGCWEPCIYTLLIYIYLSQKKMTLFVTVFLNDFFVYTFNPLIDSFPVAFL